MKIPGIQTALAGLEPARRDAIIEAIRAETEARAIHAETAAALAATRSSKAAVAAIRADADAAAAHADADAAVAAACDRDAAVAARTDADAAARARADADAAILKAQVATAKRKADRTLDLVSLDEAGGIPSLIPHAKGDGSESAGTSYYPLKDIFVDTDPTDVWPHAPSAHVLEVVDAILAHDFGDRPAVGADEAGVVQPFLKKVFQAVERAAGGAAACNKYHHSPQAKQDSGIRPRFKPDFVFTQCHEREHCLTNALFYVEAQVREASCCVWVCRR